MCYHSFTNQQTSMESEGWSDSVIKPKNSRIHYYKDGVSLCKRSGVDKGNRYFDKSERTKADVSSYHCKICIDRHVSLDKN